MTCSVDLLLMPPMTGQLGILTPNSAYASLSVPFLCQPSSGWRPDEFLTVRSNRCIESYSVHRGPKNVCFCSTRVGEFGVFSCRPHQGNPQYSLCDRASMKPREGCVRAHSDTFNPSDSLRNNDDFKGALQRHQHWPARCTAVIYQFGLHDAGNEDSTLPERLHRFLHLDSTRRLFSPQVVVTFTSLSFLIVHHRDDQFWWDDCFQGTEHSQGGSESRARLDLGLRCWKVCGFQDQVRASPMHATASIVRIVVISFSKTGYGHQVLVYVSH